MNETSWKYLIRKETVSIVGRLLTGVALLAGAFLWIEDFRATAERQNVILSRKIEAMERLWMAVESYGMSVLETVRMGTEPEETKAKLVELSSELYQNLNEAGIFFGSDRIAAIRSSVGDSFINSEMERLTSKSELVRKYALQEFRKNWLAELAALRNEVDE